MIPKYRAYHPKYGMREVVGLYWYPEYLQVSLASGIASPIRTSTRLEGVKLMQFTGLCDSYGQEIYEGDILADEEDMYYGVVYWDVAGWRVKWYPSEDTSPLDEDYFISVRGNIYENPELLGGTNDE